MGHIDNTQLPMSWGQLPDQAVFLYTVTQARITENKLKVFTWASNILNKQMQVSFTGLLFWNEGLNNLLES